MYDVLMFDFTHLCHRNFHAAKGSKHLLDPMSNLILKKLTKKEERSSEEDEELKKLQEERVKTAISYSSHLIITSLLQAIKKFPAKEIVVAWDKGTWRKEVYSEYKANRKRSRDNQTEDEKLLTLALYDMMDALYTIFEETNLISLRIRDCEADDICGVLGFGLTNEKILIVTGDSDYHQLLSKPNVDIWDPLKKKKISLSPNEARYAKFKKIIRGDSSDNIPSAKPRVRETIIKEWFDSPLEMALALADEPFKEAYERNETLISFDKIPQPVRKRIIEEYVQRKHRDKKEFDIITWAKFVKQFKLKDIMSNIDDIRKYLY